MTDPLKKSILNPCAISHISHLQQRHEQRVDRRRQRLGARAQREPRQKERVREHELEHRLGAAAGRVPGLLQLRQHERDRRGREAQTHVGGRVGGQRREDSVDARADRLMERVHTQLRKTHRKVMRQGFTFFSGKF